MSKAESSKAAASNGVKPNPNAAGGANYELPWVEKYRPVYLDDVVGNTETIERLKIIAKDGNMPHMIISGMPGIGKTTSILCLARQLLGDAYKEAVLELNASDERGIDVVRNRIKGFAQKKVTLPPGRQKLVILDEADSMTSGAQQALRRTMEIYSATTRFAFACNQSNKIIEPLQSRCAILRYARLTDAQVVRRVMQICEAEDVKYSDDGIAALVFSAEGDMRQAINNLQSTFAGFGFVNGDNVFRVVDSPHPIKVQAMIKACHEQRIDDALTSLKELWDLGYSCHDIISTMFKVTKTIDTLSEHAKLEFIKEIGFTHMRILEGTPKETKRPPPIDTSRNSTIDIAKITPPGQTDKFPKEALGTYTPKNAPVTDAMIERTYQSILRGDFGIDLNTFKPDENDPDYDVRRHLSLVQLALLATMQDDHQDRIIEAIRDDAEGSVFWKGPGSEDAGIGWRKDDEEFKAEICRQR
ncbi:replication factor C subunit 4 [Alternaria sp. BMP 0032]|nr:replication factor C subunit 4 [Alternaria sp. BMP 0032]